MKNYIYIILLLLFYACKQERKVEVKITTSKSQKTTSKVQPKTYDFSSIKNDTLFVKGKHIIFTKPSEQEFQILKNEDGINEVDSDFKFYTSKVIDSLKSTYKTTATSKRIIGVIRSYDTIYLDRLTPKARFSRNPIHYAAILVFNDYFSIYSNVYSDISYYGLIKTYFNNIRYEKLIASKYVISRNGLNIRNADGTIDDKFDNGDNVKIVGYTNNDIVLGDEDEEESIKGRWAIIKWNDNGTTKRRYVFDEFLGDIEDVKVYEDQICVGFSLNPNRNDDSDTELECLTKYFDFELISKREYQSVKTVSFNYVKNNPLVKVEENKDKTQNIILPIKDSVLVFNSKENYNSSSHSYLGDVNFLNQYLMYDVYYKAEEAFYTFIDRTTGKKTFMFEGFPNISPDKKRIISFNYDVYEEHFYIEIYKIQKDNSIKLIRIFDFIHWLEISQNDIKWLSNNEFVITIVNKMIWNGSTVKNPQYLKIKLKE